MDDKEVKARREFAIGYASALFVKYYLSDSKKFDEFLNMIDEQDKKELLKILMMDDHCS